MKRHNQDMARAYRLNPGDSRGFVDQLADLICERIRNGSLKQGDVLPKLRDLAHFCGTSLRVPREAVARLSARGLLTTRRGRGTFVSGEQVNLSRGNVLLVQPTRYAGYYHRMMYGEIEEILTQAGYSIFRTAMAPDATRRFGAESFRLLTSSQRFELVVFLAYEEQMIELVSSANVPYVVCTALPKRYAGAVARIGWAMNMRIPAFASQCVRQGVRRVCQFLLYSRDVMDIEPELSRLGIAVNTVIIGRHRYLPPQEALESIQRESMRRMFERIDTGALPDLLFFADDYVALGAFAALHARGITCPKDVKVVTFANKGLGPVGAVSYSRMEVDPVAHGRIVAEQLLRYLGGEKIRRNILLEPDYIVGESFPD